MAPQIIEIEVTTPLAQRRAQDTARDMAAAIGFAAPECEEIALAATELASNLIRHAGGGKLRLSLVTMDGCTGIQIESDDHGQGIEDFEQALTDGYSTAGSLGTGLGAVNRLMDVFERRPLRRGGTHLMCRRWLRPPATRERVAWLDIGVATCARSGQKENGDAFLVHQWNGSALACVIDGIGHGPHARRAAQAARQYVEQHFDRPLDDVFLGAGRACRGTRGVVMALARFELAPRTLTVASVGNIEARISDGGGCSRVIARRGIVGMNAPAPAVRTVPWTSSSLLVMHSDGIPAQWDLQDLGGPAVEQAEATAGRLLRAFARQDDDATVLVVRDVQA